jgi:hypothetical protein
LNSFFVVAKIADFEISIDPHMGPQTFSPGSKLTSLESSLMILVLLGLKLFRYLNPFWRCD